MKELFFKWDDAESRVVFGWQLYDWAVSPTTFAYALFIPLHIVELAGNIDLSISGKALWSYMNATATILSIMCFLTVTTAAEHVNMKRQMLLAGSYTSGVFLVLFAFTFFESALALACILYIISQVSNRIADVAYGALLDVITDISAVNHHDVSSKGYALGYMGVICFSIVGFIIVGIIVIALSPSDTAVTIIPIALLGIWFMGFTHLVGNMLPKTIGIGLPWPAEKANGVVGILMFSFTTGVREMWMAVQSLAQLNDLGFFMLSSMFISDAGSTAVSVAAVIASDVLGFSVVVILAAACCGLVAAVAGLYGYRYVHRRRWMTPKQIVITNILILTLVGLYILRLRVLWELFVLSIVGGSQIGSVGSFSRSMVSSMIPAVRQARLFSLFEFSQRGSSWIGPLCIALFTSIFGDNHFRLIVVLTVMLEIAIGFPILVCLVDYDRGLKARESIDTVSVDLDVWLQQECSQQDEQQQLQRGEVGDEDERVDKL
mmetsp:Transcript_17838/g.29914  ORF Transcript_17838/g.29914 Transcript_17838/m.29914 type:complete len:490 (+) Transcript_17838:174-1643(+)